MATILTKKSDTASSVPSAAQLTNSATGAELAVNTADKRLYTKDSGGNIVELGTNPSTLALPNGTANGVAYLNGSKVLTTGSALTFDGTNFATTGNLGLGVTPSAWISNRRALQIGGSSAAAISLNGTAVVSEIYHNAYRDASDVIRYVNSGYANVNIVASGQYQWLTAPSGTAGNAISFTQAMTLDASGNLGIGTSSPNEKLQVAGGGKFTGQASSLDQNGAFIDYASLVARISGQGSSGGTLAFYTNPNGGFNIERARIDSSGNLLVGTTSNGGKGVSLNPNGGIISNVNSTSAFTHLEIKNNNGTVGSIVSSGTTTAYNTSSDYRLKNITGPVTNSGAYIDSLKPVEGTWKADGSTFVGLIAHEVQEVSRTQVATGEKDGEQMQAMDYSSSEIIANLIAELQSLRKRVATLEAK